MELKKILLKGKEYVMVTERLRYFRETYKDGRVVTSLQITGSHCIAKAEIYINDKLVATGHGFKSIKNEFDLEKLETRAIGRALAITGIGLDAGIASYEEAKEYFELKKNKEESK